MSKINVSVFYVTVNQEFLFKNFKATIFFKFKNRPSYISLLSIKMHQFSKSMVMNLVISSCETELKVNFFFLKANLT